MVRDIPDKFYPYIKSLRSYTVIPKENMPENIKKDFFEYLKEYEITEPYYDQFNFCKPYDLKKIKKNIYKYNALPNDIKNKTYIEFERLYIKDNYIPDTKEEVDKINFYIHFFDVDIKYYKFKKYYLLFHKKDKLNILQKFLIKIGKRKVIIFY